MVGQRLISKPSCEHDQRRSAADPLDLGEVHSRHPIGSLNAC